jgi:hypothetical protein
MDQRPNDGIRGRRVNPQDVLRCLLDLEHPDPVADLIAELNIDAEAVRARMPGA